ncbi:MAG: ferredoxin--NADP reductase [Oceanicaulis sp.]
MAAVTEQTVLSVRHYTDRLFAFRVTRPPSFRFRSGEFVMLGLMINGKPLLRAYSIASPSWDEELEFFSIKVPGGPLTEHLQHIQPGDTVLLGTKSVGTLVHDALLPGEHLYLLSTGTGIAPFAAVVRDPETYERFSKVILTHTCREAAELTYGVELVAAAKADPLVGEMASAQLIHYPTTTREQTARMGRITTLIETGQLFEDLGVAPFDPARDRVMICGSMEMLADLKTLCEAAGLEEGANSRPAHYVVEKAFAG